MPRPDPALRLHPRFTHLVEADDTTVLVGDDDAVVLSRPEAAEVLTLIDGRRSAVALAGELAAELSAEVTHFVIRALRDAEILLKVRSPATSTSAEAPRDEPHSSVLTALKAAWQQRGSRRVVRLRSFRPDLDVVLTDDFLEPSLVEAASQEPDGTTLLVRLGAVQTWVGPLLRWSGGPCCSCLQERLRLNLTARALVHRHSPADRVTIRRIHRSLSDEAFSWAALGIKDTLTPAESKRPASILVIDEGGRGERHPVQQLPHCRRCGDASLTVAGARFRLRDRRRVEGSGGGLRIMTPQKTWRRYSALVSPLTGVVRRLRRVAVDGDDLIHVYTASHAHTYGRSTLKAVREDARDHSGGKGRTDLDARVSAMCESLERFSSAHRGNEPVTLARRSRLGKDALAPNELLHFSAAQFRVREAWNRVQHGDFQWIPEPYDDEPIEWVEMAAVDIDEQIFVPASHVFFDFRGEGARYCKGDSNGLAGGNCIEEAILQGFLELVERDAVALWWYNRAQRPAVDLTDFKDSYAAALQRYYRSIGRRLWVLDITTDLGIPCMVALSDLTDGRDIIFGFGAHYDPGIALVRALTELNQMLPTVARTMDERKNQLLPDFADAIHWWEDHAVEGHPYLRPSASGNPRGPTAWPAATSDNLKAMVMLCAERAREIGSGMFVYDLTRRDVGLSVVKVVVPPLRHFWRRLGAGRLYDVPVTLGWIGHPTPEEDMNPVSMFV